MAGQDKKTGKFKTAHTDDDLYEIVGLVALHVDKLRPEKLTQASFDAVAAAVAKKNKKPVPPSARAIYMRLQIEWKKIVADAVRAAGSGSSAATIVGQSKRSDEWADLDERHIFYALHRIARFLGLETLSEVRYDAGRMALIDSASPAEKRLLESVLPTAAQIKRVANDSWDLALELAGMERAQPQQQHAHPMLSLIWHYYEAKKSIPSENKLRAYANGELGKAMPKRRGRGFPDFVEELVAARKERGWTTPKDGPLDGEELTAAELALLVDGAPEWKPRERWTEDAVLACFVEFVREFLGKKDLRLRLYQGVRVARQWPSENAFAKYGTFSWWVERAKQEMLEEAAGEEAA